MRRFTLGFQLFSILFSGVSLAAGSFGGLVIPNHGQLKNGDWLKRSEAETCLSPLFEKRGLAAKTGTVPGDVGRAVWTVPAFVGAADVPVPAFQDGEAISYYMDAPWGRLYVTERGLLLNVIKEEMPATDPPGQPRDKFDPPEPRTIHQTDILLDLPGACWREPVPEDPQVTKLNFFYGNDPRGWVTDVPTYGRLRFKGFFPGADLILEPKSLEFWRAEGLHVPLLDTMEAQALATIRAAGIWLDDKLIFGQSSNSTSIQGTSATDSQKQITGDRAGAQTLLWGTYLGGNSTDWVQAMKVDGAGDIIVGGGTWSSDFPVPDGFDQRGNGEFDIFIAKLSSDGRSLLWGTFIGGWLTDDLWAMALDADMNVVLVGSTWSDNIPTTLDAFDTTFNGAVRVSTDIYAAKISATGNALLWGTYIGGQLDETAYSCAVDPAGNVVLAGKTNSPDIPVPGGFDTQWDSIYDDATDIYIAELSGDGKALLWATYLGGKNRGDQAYSICMDDKGDIIIAGGSSSPDIPTPGGFDSTLSSIYDDIYIAKISISENAVIWGTFLGGNNSENGYAVAVDSAGQIIVVGATGSADMPVPAGYDITYGGNGDFYIAKLSADGKHLLWGTYLGGKNGDSSWFGFNAAALDTEGNVLVAGLTGSDDIPVLNGFSTYRKGLDSYIAKISSSGCFLQWGSYLGGSYEDDPRHIALDVSGNIIVAGRTNSTDFPMLNGYDTSFNGPGYKDGFIVKLTNPEGLPPQLFVPAAARTPGAHATNWRTDGMVLNSGHAEVCYDLYFSPGDESAVEFHCETRCLAEGETIAYRDILGTACGVTGSGAGSMRLESTGELTMNTRTYNVREDGGTYGQYIKAQPGHGGLRKGQLSHLIGLKQSAEYRTNLGFTEIMGQSTDLVVRVFDSSGSLLQTSAFSLRPSGWRQMGLAELGIANLDVGRAEVEVSGGGMVLSYASVVDNRTGDAVYLPVQESPTIIPGILGGGGALVAATARTQGAHGTKWRTELTLYNPSEEAYDITLTYRSGGAEYSSNRYLSSGRMLIFDDLIGQAFPALQGDTAGFLEVWAYTDLFVSSRTYNLMDVGTYGQSVPVEKITNVWSGGRLFPMTQTEEYRTNIGLVEVSGRAMDVQIAVFDSSGSMLLTSSISLAPYAWRQISLAELGISNLESGWAEISVTSAGGIFFYASVVDNLTGDAIFIPALK